MTVRDALTGKHGEYEIVLANPPFGKTSRVTIVNAAGEQQQAGRVSNHGRCSRAMIINHMASCSWPKVGPVAVALSCSVTRADSPSLSG